MKINLKKKRVHMKMQIKLEKNYPGSRVSPNQTAHPKDDEPAVSYLQDNLLPPQEHSLLSLPLRIPTHFLDRHHT
jgi:hypothetical protein